MLTHAEIVKRAGAPEQVAADRSVSIHTVRSWIQRNSIPPDQWMAFVNAGHASFEEIANPDARGKIAA